VKCLLVAPRFAETTYWNYWETAELFGRRYSTAPLGLVTVAALLPQDWDLRLSDLNVRELDPGLIDWADLVMVGGMITQQAAILAIVELCHARGKRVVVGGPDPTSQPHVYAAAEYLVLDEGESTVPMFLADLAAGARRGIYRSAEKPDLTLSPVPRFDLLELDQYLYMGVQFSRGCPFNCEFCDIIELYGRRARAKTAQQMRRELDRLHGLGYTGHVSFVDDNFIGDRKRVMAFLPELAAWSEAAGFPYFFSTEATINLAHDDRLLALMQAADFRNVFVGIETPDAALLAATQKKQNIRYPVVDSVHRLQAHGLVVSAGLIIGFDGESREAAPTLVACAEAAGIPMAMVSILEALPTTQLTKRLAREGRLAEDFARAGEFDDFGLNFVPTRPAIEVLEDFAAIVDRLYSPAGFFARVRRLARTLRQARKQISPATERRREAAGLGRLVWRLGFARETAWVFWRSVLEILATCPRNIVTALGEMALYPHFRKQSRAELATLARRIARIRAGEPDPSAGRAPVL
jgi:radical SAM superfamily enzyme YgiQ (UPF0313 family)